MNLNIRKTVSKRVVGRADANAQHASYAWITTPDTDTPQLRIPPKTLMDMTFAC